MKDVSGSKIQMMRYFISRQGMKKKPFPKEIVYFLQYEYPEFIATGFRIDHIVLNEWRCQSCEEWWSVLQSGLDIMKMPLQLPGLHQGSRIKFELRFWNDKKLFDGIFNMFIGRKLKVRDNSCKKRGTGNGSEERRRPNFLQSAIPHASPPRASTALALFFQNYF